MTMNLINIHAQSGICYSDDLTDSDLYVDVHGDNTTTFEFKVSDTKEDIVITVDSGILKKILEAMLVAYQCKMYYTIIEIDGDDCFRLYDHDDDGKRITLAINNRTHEVHIDMDSVLIISKLL